jgi:hypothetical protein
VDTFCDFLELQALPYGVRIEQTSSVNLWQSECASLQDTDVEM